MQPRLFDPPPPTVIDRFAGDYAFLSNFAPVIVHLDDGEDYPSVEHAFQAAKTYDPIERARVRNALDPGVAKRLGRQVTLRTDWDDVRLEVMETLVREKFSDQGLAAALVATAPLHLVEGNTWGDCFWGVCRGAGANHLGRILEKVRDELIAERA